MQIGAKMQEQNLKIKQQLPKIIPQDVQLIPVEPEEKNLFLSTVQKTTLAAITVGKAAAPIVVITLAAGGYLVWILLQGIWFLLVFVAQIAWEILQSINQNPPRAPREYPHNDEYYESKRNSGITINNITNIYRK